MEKKYNQVLQKQGIDAEEIENIWKLLPKTKENRKNIGLQDNLYDSEVYHEDEQVDEKAINIFYLI